MVVSGDNLPLSNTLCFQYMNLKETMFVVNVVRHDTLRSLTLPVILVSAFNLLYKGVLYMYSM